MCWLPRKTPTGLSLSGAGGEVLLRQQLERASLAYCLDVRLPLVVGGLLQACEDLGGLAQIDTSHALDGVRQLAKQGHYVAAAMTGLARGGHEHHLLRGVERLDELLRDLRELGHDHLHHCSFAELLVSAGLRPENVRFGFSAELDHVRFALAHEALLGCCSVRSSGDALGVVALCKKLRSRAALALLLYALHQDVGHLQHDGLLDLLLLGFLQHDGLALLGFLDLARAHGLSFRLVDLALEESPLEVEVAVALRLLLELLVDAHVSALVLHRDRGVSLSLGARHHAARLSLVHRAALLGLAAHHGGLSHA
mmetsp:Transcript_4967/g.15801  ORF Transcript_4967/g.15801 Transcript_4967/m.15801 type:complete len:311 (+) Transcript_4967:382-1314(+)